MAHVPDTTTFALSDVDTVLSLYADYGTFGSVTMSNGKAVLNNASSVDVRVGSLITITNSTYYDGLCGVTAYTSTTITTDIIYIADDSGSWDLEIYSLGDMFTAAAHTFANRFDYRYVGTKDRLSNFRNYGPTGTLIYADGHDNTGVYAGIHSNADWIFVAAGAGNGGVISYYVADNGDITLKNAEFPPGNESYRDVWVQDSLIFITSKDSVAGKTYLRTYTYNALTGVMYVADVYEASTSIGDHNVFGDGTDVICMVEPAGASTVGIMTFTYDGSGNITYKTRYNADSARYYDGVYTGGYLFVVGTNGITSFAVNTTTGVLTKEDNDNLGTFTGSSIIYDSTNGLQFVGSQSDGAIVYSHSSGILTQEYREGSGARLFPAYHPPSNYIYFRDNSNVYRYRVDENNDLVYVGSQSFTISGQLHYWYIADNVIVATDGSNGLETYTIDYD